MFRLQDDPQGGLNTIFESQRKDYVNVSSVPKCLNASASSRVMSCPTILAITCFSFSLVENLSPVVAMKISSPIDQSETESYINTSHRPRLNR